MTDEARAARKSSPSKRGGETLLSCLVVLVSLFVVVDDAKSSLLAINGIPSSLSSSSSSKTTNNNNNNNNHKYAFTPTNGKMLYSWVARGRALPSERSAKSVDAGAKERDAVESSSEFKYMHMAMPTILPDGSIAVGAFVRLFFASFLVFISLFVRFFARAFIIIIIIIIARSFVCLRARRGLSCVSSSSLSSRAAG